jgi:hypothetical protein
VFTLLLVTGCGDMDLGWGWITGVFTAEQVKPYNVQGAGVLLGVGRRELNVVLPIADQMGTQPLSPSRFAELGGKVYDDSRCSFAAAECRRLSTCQDPIFLIVSVRPKSELIKWPVQYHLTILDAQKGKYTCVAIQPLASSSDSQYNEVGFCTRLEGADEFSLLFVVPKTVAQSMIRAELISVQGTCKWKKDTKKQ